MKHIKIPVSERDLEMIGKFPREKEDPVEFNEAVCRLLTFEGDLFYPIYEAIAKIREEQHEEWLKTQPALTQLAGTAE